MSEDRIGRYRPELTGPAAREDHRRILAAGGGHDSFTVLSAFDGYTIDIRREIEGKKVADMGSGFGGFVKSAFILGFIARGATIWSINPAMASADVREAEARATTVNLSINYNNITEAQIAAAQAYHDAHLSTNVAHKLNDFQDNEFDLLIDRVAVHSKMPPDERVYVPTIQEMIRVLKPGGKIIVIDFGDAAVTDTKAEKEGVTLSRARILDQLGLPFEYIYFRDRSQGTRPIGVVIHKPA